MQHIWFEDHQFAIGHLSNRPHSSKLEAELCRRAVTALHLKISFPDNTGCIFQVDNPERMKKQNIWKKVNYSDCLEDSENPTSST